jgi:hypothetical protein
MSERPEDGPSIAERRKVELRVLRVPASGTIKVRFLGDVQGMHLHWVGKSPLPCEGTKCPEKVHRVRAQWCGFAAVENLDNGPPPEWVPAVLEVTERLQSILPCEGLRGSVYHLFRRPGPGRHPVNSGDFVDSIDPRPLRTDVDVWRHCARMYQSNDIQWGLQPLFDGPQVLDVTPGLTGCGAKKAENDPLADFVCLRPQGMRLTEYVEMYALKKEQFIAALAGKGGKP